MVSEPIDLKTSQKKKKNSFFIYALLLLQHEFLDEQLHRWCY